MKYHQDKDMKKQRAEKEEQQRLRRICTTLTKEVKQFWSQIDKVTFNYLYKINDNYFNINIIFLAGSV